MSVKSRDVVYERVFVRLLSEGIKDPADVTGLACAFDAQDPYPWATVYDVAKLDAYLEEEPISSRTPKEVVDLGVVVSYSRIRPASPAGGNWGAWEVTNSAGNGKLAYATAFALSPSLRLIPDRNSVSDKAAAAWKRQFDAGRKRKPLDDVDHPRTPEKYDDGVLYREERPGDEVLNYAYEASGWERKAFRDMAARWDEKKFPKHVAFASGKYFFTTVYFYSE